MAARSRQYEERKQLDKEMGVRKEARMATRRKTKTEECVSLLQSDESSDFTHTATEETSELSESTDENSSMLVNADATSEPSETTKEVGVKKGPRMATRRKAKEEECVSLLQNDESSDITPNTTEETSELSEAADENSSMLVNADATSEPSETTAPEKCELLTLGVEAEETNEPTDCELASLQESNDINVTEMKESTEECGILNHTALPNSDEKNESANFSILESAKAAALPSEDKILDECEALLDELNADVCVTNPCAVIAEISKDGECNLNSSSSVHADTIIESNNDGDCSISSGDSDNGRSSI